jgi:hypothetical protein
MINVKKAKAGKMAQHRKTFLMVLLVIIIIGLAAGGYWLSRKKPAEKSPAAEGQPVSAAANESQAWLPSRSKWPGLKSRTWRRGLNRQAKFIPKRM